MNQELIIPNRTLCLRSNKPFSSFYINETVPYGKNVLELVKETLTDTVYHQYSHVTINGQLIPYENWGRVRPKPGTVVSISIVPQGGGGRLLAQIGLAALTIAAFVFLGPVGGVLVGVGGQILLSQLLPPPVPKISKGFGNQSPTYAIGGGKNQSNIWGKVPFVLGAFRVVPLYAAAPYREVVGDKIYWRVLFCLGHGPLTYGNLQIGDTDISAYQGVELEYRRGYWSLDFRGNWDASGGEFPSSAIFDQTWTITTGGVIDGILYQPGQTITYNGLASINSRFAWDVDQEKPFTLYPNDVDEQNLAVQVNYGVPQVRTSVVGADTLGVQIVFDQGLYYLQNQPAGKPGDSSVSITIQQSPTGQNNWTTVKTTVITGRQSTPLYWGWSWNTKDYGAQDANKQYDIRFIRNNDTDPNHTVYDKFTWFSLRTITWGTPVPTYGICMIAMRILASGQLQGVIDTFNLVATSICRDYDSASNTWIWRPTTSPTALYRHALQHPMARDVPIPDNRLDFTRLQHWDGFCKGKAFNISGIIDEKMSTWEVLTTIARVGRASPTLRDFMYSVVIDEPKDSPIRMFTPRNCWNYNGSLDHSPLPHAYRVGFINKDIDWKNDEVIVYDDGYGESNATRYERIDWIGITNRNQAWAAGRYHIAQTRLRREIHTIETDFEFLACERGDLVAFQHDAIAVGLGTARIVTSNAYGCSIDVPVEMENGKSYGFRLRGIDTVNINTITTLFQVNTDASGPVTNLTFPTPVQYPPGIGELLSFGEYNRDTMRLLVQDIVPGPNLTAKLTLIAEGAGVHTAEFGQIPAYDPVVSLPRTIPAPVILSIESSARVMIVVSRFLMTRVIFILEPINIDGCRTVVLFKPSGTFGQWSTATVQEETTSTVAITGVNSGETYDFRLIRTHPDYLSSAATAVTNYRVIGRSEPPQGLKNFTLAISGGQALLQWDLPEDLDVQYGGWIIFRHTIEMDAPVWSHSTSIGRTINGDQTFVWLPLKAGTYMGRVYDSDGLESAEIVYFPTKQASILNYINLGTLAEEPDFSGTKVNCEVVDDYLQLISANVDFDSVVDVDSLISWDIGGDAVAPSGSYEFGTGWDFTTVSRVHITSHIKIEAVNQYALMDSDDLMDSQEDFDGTSGAPIDAQVWGTFTDDDPSGTPAWSPMTRIDALEINHRAIGNITCYLFSADPVYNLRITELQLVANVLS